MDNPIISFVFIFWHYSAISVTEEQFSWLLLCATLSSCNRLGFPDDARNSWDIWVLMNGQYWNAESNCIGVLHNAASILLRQHFHHCHFQTENHHPHHNLHRIGDLTKNGSSWKVSADCSEWKPISWEDDLLNDTVGPRLSSYVPVWQLSFFNSSIDGQ